MIKLTPSLKRKITRDWNAAFPSMAVYKPMWIARRIGPIIQGICLDRNESNEVYRPVLHLHFLVTTFPCVAFYMPQTYRSATGATKDVKVQFHDTYLDEATEQIASSSLLPLQGPWQFSDLLHAIDKYEHTQDCVLSSMPELFSAVVLNAIWLGDVAAARNLMSVYAKKMMSMPFPYPLDLDKWRLPLIDAIENPDLLRKVVESQIEQHKLQALPASDLVL